MKAIPKHRMTVDRYFAWAETRPGRFGLLDGAVYEMSPETVGHSKTRAAIYVALMRPFAGSGHAVMFFWTDDDRSRRNDRI